MACAEQPQITIALYAALAALKSVAYDPIPHYDQLTEYVYETDVIESKDGITIRLAKRLVKQDDVLADGTLVEMEQLK